jgi:hypothetical protein
VKYYDDLEMKTKSELSHSTSKLKVLRFVLEISLVSLILLCIAVSVYVYRLQY